MVFPRCFAFAAWLSLAAVVPPLVGAQPQHRPTDGVPVYTVAVLSPSEGPLRGVGRSHEGSVKAALLPDDAPIEGTLMVRNEDHVLRLLFLSSVDPTADPATCVAQAQRAVQEEDAVALLGPVTSGCTKRILAANLQVPVLSSLATARYLGEETRWFFRTIAHDQVRLQTFVDTARAHAVNVDHSIVIHQESVYGLGLLDHLRGLVRSLDADHTYTWRQAIVDTTHTVATTDGFREAMRAHHHAIDNVFVLGSSSRIVEVIDALDALFEDDLIEGDPSFVLVGSTRNADRLPVDTWLIGEAQVKTSDNLVQKIRWKIEDQPRAGDFYVSTLDASLALATAVERVVQRTRTAPLPPAQMRVQLQTVLDQEHFPSSERGRFVGFASGETQAPPSFPIYRVSADPYLEHVNPDRVRPWVEIRVVDAPRGHLEGPVVLELIPHGPLQSARAATAPPVVDLQVVGLDDDPITVRQVALGQSAQTVSFVPSFFAADWFPSTLTITTSETPEERVEIDGIRWPVSYLLALLSAAFGGLLYTRYRTIQPSARAVPVETSRPALAATSTEADVDDAPPPVAEASPVAEAPPVSEEPASRGGPPKRPWTLWTYLERCAAGFLIAFLVIHVAPLLEDEPVLSQIPIPQFGASQWVNAVLAGLMGGWMGLNPIIALVASIIGALGSVFQTEGG
jgi:ABC-type branched-subunit amino acid transport system substrate-binding protein